MQKPWPAASTGPVHNFHKRRTKFCLSKSVIQSKQNLILFRRQGDLVSIDFDIFASQAALKIKKILRPTSFALRSSHISVILDVLFENFDSEFEILTKWEFPSRELATEAWIYRSIWWFEYLYNISFMYCTCNDIVLYSFGDVLVCVCLFSSHFMQNGAYAVAEWKNC